VTTTSVQISPEATGSAISITPTLGVASTAGNLLVCWLIQGGGNAWTLPAGWQRADGLSNSGISHAEIWYYPNNPGGITGVLCSVASGTPNIKGYLQEFHTDVANATWVLNSHGTGPGGTVAQVTVAGGTNSASGDLWVCCFHEHFTTAAAVTWTDPAGFTLGRSDTASAGNHLYGGYDLSVALGGPVSVTGKSNTASDNAHGWAGVVATFSPAPPATGTPGLVGAYVPSSPFPAGTTQAQAINTWQADSGRTLTVRRQYYTTEQIPAGSPVPTDLAADIAAGRKVCMSLRPAFNPPTSADLAALDTFLSAMKTAGLNAEVSLWQEPYGSGLPGHVSDGLTQSLFVAGWQFYATTIRQYFPMTFDTSIYSVNHHGENAYYPGDAWVDRVATDFYCSEYNGGERLDLAASIADAASPPKPFGLWEANSSTDPASGQTQAQATAYFGYVKTFFTARLTAGKPNADIMVFNSNSVLTQETAITVPDGSVAPNGVTEYRNALFDQWFDALNGTSGTTALNITTATVPNGTSGTAYPSTTLAAAGGTPAYTWSLASGTLPTGLSLSSAGVITGTPTVAGVYNFTVQVADTASHTDTQAYSVTIAAVTAVSVTTSSLPAAEAGSAYSATFAAANGTTPYTWSQASGTLPAGLAFSSAGVLSGTPTAAGSQSVTFQVTDATAATSTVTLTVTVAAKLAVATASLPGGVIGQAYSGAVAASGGVGSLTWSTISGSLPAGLTLNASTGAVTGTPTTGGTSSFTVQAADAYTTATRALSITVTSLTVTTTTLPGGTTGTAYTATLAAAGGTPAYTWSLTSGSLPAGLTLSSAGVISGTPVQAGTFSVGVTVTDSLAATAAAVLGLLVVSSGDSLLLTPDIELLAGGVASTIPACAGAVFLLVPGFDLSAPQPTANMVASMLDGERPAGQPHAANRQPSLPVKITAPDRATLAAAREVLIRAVSARTFTVTWTRAGGLPFVLDCYSAQATVVDYDLLKEASFVSNVLVSFEAHPYGRSDQPVTVDFPVPLSGRTPPASPVLIDDFSTVSGTRWSQALIGPGPFSAHYDPAGSGTGLVASYTRSGMGPLNLAGLNGLSVIAGFGASLFFPWWGQGQRGPVQFAFTLSDGTHSATTHVTRKVRTSGNASDPAFQRIHVPIPSGSSLNLAAITGYTIKISNRQAGDLQYTDVYLDTFRAVPYASAQQVQPASGNLVSLAGIAGSARSAVSLQFTQPPGSVQTVTRKWTTPGTFYWRAPGGLVSAQRTECTGPAGKGSTDTSGAGRAGGPGGEYAAEPGLPMTAGALQTIVVPHGGQGPAGTPGDAKFTTDLGVTVRGHGGANMADNVSTGVAGATGYAPIQQLAGQNSSFDGGIGNWVGTGNGTATADATQHQAGTGSLKLTSTASGDMSAGSCLAANYASQGEPCDPLLPVVVNGYAKAATTVRACSLGAEFWDSNGVSLGTLYGADLNNSTSAFVALTQATLSPPSGAVWCRARARVKATAAGSEAHWFDTVTLTSGAANAGGAGGSGSGTAGGGGGGAGGPDGAGSAGQAGSSGGAGGTGGGGDAGRGGQGGTGVAQYGSPGRPGGGGGGGAGQRLLLPDLAGYGGDAKVAVTYTQTIGWKTLVVHQPGFDAPDTFTPWCALSANDPPDGTAEYTLPQLIDGSAARFGDPDRPFTVTVYVVASSWHNPSAARTVTATVRQYEQAGGTVYPAAASQSITPANLKSPLVLLGELTLPVSAMPLDNTGGYFTVAITSGDTADRFQDALFLDTLGSTVVVQSPTGYTSYWVDEPAGSAEIGNIMGSMFDRGQAVSVLGSADVSGPPLHVDPFGNQTLLAYSPDGAPACQLTHFSRWQLERLA